MKTLWDQYPDLPYKVWVPWPQIEDRGYQDWDRAVDLVDSWLINHVGHRWVDWTWGWATFKMDLNYNTCCVNFKKETSCSLFLLRFS